MHTILHIRSAQWLFLIRHLCHLDWMSVRITKHLWTYDQGVFWIYDDSFVIRKKMTVSAKTNWAA